MSEEIKSFKVHPDYESEEINYRQRFGWEFVSTQEIYNKDTHLERGISDIILDTTTSVTETTHYVKLTFKRDRSKINPRLVEIEEELEHLSPPVRSSYGCDWVAGLVGAGGFLLCGIIAAALNNSAIYAMGWVAVLIGVFIRRKKRTSDIESEYYEAKKAYDEKLEQLMRELDSI